MDEEVKEIFSEPTDTTPVIVETPKQQEIVVIDQPQATEATNTAIALTPKKEKEIDEDYNYTRDTCRDMVDKGKVALDKLIDLATASDSPRAFEVVATLIKNLAETTDRLMDLHKKTIEIEQAKKPVVTPNVNNNNVFLSTKDLLEIIKKK